MQLIGPQDFALNPAMFQSAFVYVVENTKLMLSATKVEKKIVKF